MATRDMPWVPANMTPERRKRLEAFSRLRRISRQEAAGLLIDAGIEAMKPVIAAELAQTRAKIEGAVLPKIRPVEKEWIGERFLRALNDPEQWCISGRCEDTNWGGRDRLHSRSEGCPPFDRREIEGYLERAKKRLHERRIYSDRCICGAPWTSRHPAEAKK
jgi:hypothetical protein